MTNWLRVVSVSSATFLFALSVWAAVAYGGPLRFLPGVVTAMTILLLPKALAYAKLWSRRGRRYLTARRRGAAELDATFVSDEPDPNPDGALSCIADAIGGGIADSVRRESFPEGEGLMVRHGGFHNSFVRLTGGGQLVVTGASKRTRALAERVADIRGVSMRNRSNNPLVGPIPVRGAPRWFLALGLVAILVVGVMGVVNAAYATDTYTAPEKAVLVSYDARADFDPGTSPTDARLGKAEFLIGALSEEAVEVAWEQNESRYIVEDGRQAIEMSRDVRTHLRTAREGSLTPDQRERAASIETDLHAAERDVAGALGERLETGTAGPYAGEVRLLRERLLRLAEQPV
ncbi:hypothetical protein [Halorarum salinum]|uniref:hypothetical protein n=1 Tax=Halorarum salinum TaxID=2743089 RepID=UPI001C52E020|nr:hypothetical protein [Halobaculum salinum]